MSLTEPLLSQARAPSAPEPGGWSIVLLLYHRRVFIGTFTLVTVVLAVGVSLLRRPYYEATTIIIPPSPSSGLGALSGVLAGGAASLIGEGTLGIRNSGETYVSLLKSRTVEDAVIDRYNLMKEYDVHRMSDARKVLDQRTTIFYGPRDGMVRLSLYDHDPNRAAELANGYMEQFRSFSSTLAITEASKRRQFYEHELSSTNEKLANAELALKATEDQTGILHVDSQAKALIESAASLRASIAAKQVEIQSLETYAAEGNPSLVVAKRELGALQAQLSKLNTNDDPQDVILSKGSISAGSLAYIRSLREVKYQEAVFEALSRQYEAAQLDEARQGTSVQLVDKAVAPDKKMPQYRAFVVLLAALAGFLAACGWLIVRDRWENSLFAARWRDLRTGLHP